MGDILRYGVIRCKLRCSPLVGVGSHRQAEGGEWLVRKVTERLIRMGREGGAPAQGRYLHAVSTIVSFYPSVLTRSLLIRYGTLGTLPQSAAARSGLR